MTPQMGVVTDADLAAAVAAHNALTIVHGTVDDVADQTDIETHRAVLDAHHRHHQEILRTGNYYTSLADCEHSGLAVAITADRLYAIVCPIPRDITIDRIQIHVQAPSGAGTRARLGIYNNGTNLYPGTLLADYGAVLTDAAVAVEIVINQALVKGIYWLAILAEAAPTLYVSAEGLNIVGRTLSYRHFGSWRAVQAYGALPDPYPAGAAEANEMWRVAFRVLSLD